MPIATKARPKIRERERSTFMGNLHWFGTGQGRLEIHHRVAARGSGEYDYRISFKF
jgi:hypothetical protein